MDTLTGSANGSALNAKRSSCKNDVPLAVQVCFDPVTQIEKYWGKKLDPWQDELARGTDDVMVISSRQIGKTLGVCFAVTAHTLSTNDSLSVVISPTARQSGLVLRTCRSLILKIPPAGRPRITKDSQTVIELSTGSSIMALPSGSVSGGTGVNLRGLSVNGILVIEEACFIPDDLYFSVLKQFTITARGRTIIISTPSSAIGWAYDLYTSGTMRTVEIKATECSRISQKFLEREQKSMPKAHFLREYMCRFISPHAGIFDPEKIEEAFRPLPDNPMRQFLPNKMKVDVGK
jgi:hypothetical protein